MSYNYATVDEEGKVAACPECDSTHIYERERAYRDEEDTPYKCRSCDTGFDEFVVRESRKGMGKDAVYEHLSLEDVGLEPLEGT